MLSPNIFNYGSKSSRERVPWSKSSCDIHSGGDKVPRVQKFLGAKVFGLFALREQMFQGTKVPRERKFHLWTFRSRERKCRGTKSPDTVYCVKGVIISPECKTVRAAIEFICQLIMNGQENLTAVVYCKFSEQPCLDHHQLRCLLLTGWPRWD